VGRIAASDKVASPFSIHALKIGPIVVVLQKR